MEFLVTITQDWSALRGLADLSERVAEERRVGRELLAAGVIVRIWRVPGQRVNVGVWRAADATELMTYLIRLPLWDWVQADVLALATHELEAAT